jgi:hypothetical protein
MLPDFERADRIGEFWGYPESRAFAELLIDCEEDRTLRAVLVGMLREGTGTPRALHGRDARGAASTEMASCVPVEPRPVGSVSLRFETCLAAKGRMAVQQVPARSTGLAAVDQETQESSHALCSRPRTIRRPSLKVIGRTPDRLRGGPDASSGAHRHASGGGLSWAVTTQTEQPKRCPSNACPPARHPAP